LASVDVLGAVVLCLDKDTSSVLSLFILSMIDNEVIRAAVTDLPGSTPSFSIF
jgi:hypothetical protein